LQFNQRLMEFDPHWIEVLQVVVSIFLGGLIGMERELAAKPAGLRTHMLVAGAATLFVILGEFMIQQFSDLLINEVLRADPIRIMEAIITGISFLGAGTIIFNNKGSTVEGLTTAASILFVAAIGITVALGQFAMAAILTIVVVGILQLLGLVERWIKKMRAKAGYPPKRHNDK